jgi:hypothetical protein
MAVLSGFYTMLAVVVLTIIATAALSHFARHFSRLRIGRSVTAL